MKTRMPIKLLSFSVALPVLLFMFFSSSMQAEAGGSQTSCYSTFRIAGEGCTYTVTDCGPCTAITVFEYRDSGKCKSSSWIYDPPTIK